MCMSVLGAATATIAVPGIGQRACGTLALGETLMAKQTASLLHCPHNAWWPSTLGSGTSEELWAFISQT